MSSQDLVKAKSKILLFEWWNNSEHIGTYTLHIELYTYNKIHTYALRAGGGRGTSVNLYWATMEIS